MIEQEQLIKSLDYIKDRAKFLWEEHNSNNALYIMEEIDCLKKQLELKGVNNGSNSNNNI